MSAVFCQPLPITYVSSSTLTVAEPKNMTNDEPGMVWRSSSLSPAYVVFSFATASVDTIALVGNNVRSSGTMRVRIGTTAAQVNGTAPFDQTFSAWSGIAPVDDAISMFLLSAPVTGSFIRIDFSDAGNPAGYFQCCRLVIGKRVTNAGIDIGHEEVFDDTSGIEDAYGAVTIDKYGIRQQHKITISHVKEEEYYASWRPFLASVGMSKFFLYAERTDDPYQQHKTFFVRNSAQPKRVNTSYDQQQIELQVTTYK